MARRTVQIVKCDDCGRDLDPETSPSSADIVLYKGYVMVRLRLATAVPDGTKLDLCFACLRERLEHSFLSRPLRAACIDCGGFGKVRESAGGPSPDFHGVECPNCRGRGVPELPWPRRAAADEEARAVVAGMTTPLNLRDWRIRPFAKIEVEARAEIQQTLDNYHQYSEGVESEFAVATLLEVDRLRDLLSRLREAFRQADWHGLEMEDPELARAIDAAIGSPKR